MPPPFRQIGPNQVELREGGGWLAVAGVPVLILGLFTTFTGLGIVPTGSVLLGLLFIGAGAALTFGRRRTVFDAGQARVIRGWSLVVPIRQNERSLSEFSAVLIGLDLNPDAGDSYPVRLRARLGKDLAICSSGQFGESRDRAEFLARFLHLDLVDRSTDHEVVLSPEQAGATLQGRLRSGQLQPERVARPATMRSEVEESDAQARLVIRGHRWTGLPLALGAAVPVGIALFLIPLFHRTEKPGEKPDPMQFVPLAVLIFAFGFVPLLIVLHSALSAIRSRTAVTASRTGILIDRRGVWRKRTTLIPAGDILALDYNTVDSMLDAARQKAMESGRAVSGFSSSRWFAALKNLVPSKGIVVKSRSGLFTFGEGLSGDELRYLQSIIMRALAH